jgi:hypothetical protein
MRSGVRWLVRDGHACREGEAIAFCNVSLRPTAAGLADPLDDAGGDNGEMQVILAAPAAGRLRIAGHSSMGGFIDRQASLMPWTADFEIGALEAPSGRTNDGDLRALMVAGQRSLPFADDHRGVLSGVYARTRAWWGEGEAAHGTILGLGVCDQDGALRGDSHACQEMFALTPGPAQVVFAAEDPVVYCARGVLEGLERTEADVAAIGEDMARGLAGGPVTPTATDWLFAGGFLNAIGRSRVDETHTLVTRSGIRRSAPADAILMSVASEGTSMLRHRRLGYAFRVHDYRLRSAGPAVKAWLRRDFEPVRRTVDDIRADFQELLHRLGPDGPALMVLNQMSTSSLDQLYFYAPFDRPMSDVLARYRARELNLMLHDLAADHGLVLVDFDAIAAEMGARAHLPDGTHLSGEMEAELRGEILRLLRARGVPGF